MGTLIYILGTVVCMIYFYVVNYYTENSDFKTSLSTAIFFSLFSWFGLCFSIIVMSVTKLVKDKNLHDRFINPREFKGKGKK